HLHSSLRIKLLTRLRCVPNDALPRESLSSEYSQIQELVLAPEFQNTSERAEKARAALSPPFRQLAHLVSPAVSPPPGAAPHPPPISQSNPQIAFPDSQSTILSVHDRAAWSASHDARSVLRE